ncbi:putative PDDEXK endonuclease [Candidatus Darwinibacter acetoxidans]
MTANTPASRKAKGRRLQQAVRQDLIDRLGIDPGDILSTGMGQSGCDLYLSPAARAQFPFGIECKAQERIALPEWWQQCVRNAAAEGLAPLLILKQSRREPLAVLRWSDLLALLRQMAELNAWGRLVSDGILTAAKYPDEFQILSLSSLAVHYRDHLCSGDDHRWENLAKGLTGGRP